MTNRIISSSPPPSYYASQCGADAASLPAYDAPLGSPMPSSALSPFAAPVRPIPVLAAAAVPALGVQQPMITSIAMGPEYAHQNIHQREHLFSQIAVLNPNCFVGSLYHVHARREPMAGSLLLFTRNVRGEFEQKTLLLPEGFRSIDVLMAWGADTFIVQTGEKILIYRIDDLEHPKVLSIADFSVSTKRVAYGALPQNYLSTPVRFPRAFGEICSASNHHMMPYHVVNSDTLLVYVNATTLLVLVKQGTGELQTQELNIPSTFGELEQVSSVSESVVHLKFHDQNTYLKKQPSGEFAYTTHITEVPKPVGLPLLEGFSVNLCKTYNTQEHYYGYTHLNNHEHEVYRDADGVEMCVRLSENEILTVGRFMREGLHGIQTKEHSDFSLYNLQNSTVLLPEPEPLFLCIVDRTALEQAQQFKKLCERSAYSRMSAEQRAQLEVYMNALSDDDVLRAISGIKSPEVIDVAIQKLRLNLAKQLILQLDAHDLRTYLRYADFLCSHVTTLSGLHAWTLEQMLLSSQFESCLKLLDMPMDKYAERNLLFAYLKNKKQLSVTVQKAMNAWIQGDNTRCSLALCLQKALNDSETESKAYQAKNKAPNQIHLPSFIDKELHRFPAFQKLRFGEVWNGWALTE